MLNVEMSVTIMFYNCYSSNFQNYPNKLIIHVPYELLDDFQFKNPAVTVFQPISTPVYMNVAVNEKQNLLPDTHSLRCRNIKVTSNSSIGLSRILATSRATFPCPSMTAVSALKSGSS